VGSQGLDARNRRVAPVFGVEGLGSQTPYRVGAVIAKRPERSEGAPKALDDDGAMGPASRLKGLNELSPQFRFARTSS
jgi:hypothetical protein